MTKAGCHSERIKFSGLPRGGLRLRASERLRNRLRLPRCVRSCARETNWVEGARPRVTRRGAERRRRRGGDGPFGAERPTGRRRAGPARPSPSGSSRALRGAERSYPRPAHGGGLRRLCLGAPPAGVCRARLARRWRRLEASQRTSEPDARKGRGRSASGGVIRAERSGESLPRGEAISGGAGCPCRCAKRACGWWRWVLAGGRLARRRTPERSAAERSVRGRRQQVGCLRIADRDFGRARKTAQRV